MPLPLHAVDADDSSFTAELGNHFFYLLSEGAVAPAGFGVGTPFNLTVDALVHNGNTALVGVGHSKASAIWYKALTTHFTSTMSYPLARAATLRAARELHGDDSFECNAVAEAWNAAKTV
jgi:Zn-dependent metalloprotease